MSATRSADEPDGRDQLLDAATRRGAGDEGDRRDVRPRGRAGRSRCRCRSRRRSTLVGSSPVSCANGAGRGDEDAEAVAVQLLPGPDRLARLRRHLDPEGVVLEERVVVDVDDGRLAEPPDGRPNCLSVRSSVDATSGPPRQTCQRGPRSSRSVAVSGSTRRSSSDPTAGPQPRARRRGSAAGGRRPSGVGRPRGGSARAGSPSHSVVGTFGTIIGQRRRRQPGRRGSPPCYSPARMATTAEARPLRAARRPGAVELVTDGFREIWSRRRLIRYLVRADLKKHGSDTAPRQRLVDPRPAPPDGRLRRPRLGHLQDQQGRLPAVRLLRRSCPGSGSRPASTTAITSVTSRERIIKQVKFPKLVLPVVGDGRRDRQLRVRADPALRPDALLLLGPAQLVPPVHPGRSPPSSSSSASPARSSSRRSTSSSGTSPTSPATRCGCGSTCRPRSTPTRTSPAGSAASVGKIVLLNPWTPLFESYRAVIYNETMPYWVRPRSSCSSARIDLPRARDALLQAARAGLREGPVSDRATAERAGSPTTRSTSAALGVRYNLRLTRQTTVRELVPRPAQAARGPEPLLGAARRLVPRRPRREPRGHRPERRRQEHAAPGARRDHPAERGRRSTSSATCRAC